jgi:hypothetical protein
MSDLHKIRAEIAKVFLESGSPDVGDCLSILDAHIAEAERKPSGEWYEQVGGWVWALQGDKQSAVVLKEGDTKFTYLIGLPSLDECANPPVNPTLLAAQLAAEEAMKKMEEKHVS